MKRKLLENARTLLLSWPETGSFIAVPGASVAWQQAHTALGCASFHWDLACRYLEEALSMQGHDGGIRLQISAGTTSSGDALLETPCFAPALWRLMEHAPDTSSARTTIRRFFDAVYAHQIHWYKERALDEGGLVYIAHPLEAAQPLAAVWESEPYAERSTRYRLQGVHEGVPGAEESDTGVVKVLDPYLNALLALSNIVLMRMGNMLERNVQELLEQHELTVFAMNEQLWNAEYGIFCPYDLEREELRLSGAIGGWMPWAAAAPDQSRAEIMREAFELNFLQEGYFLGASNSLFATGTDATFPDRGAVHFRDVWLLYQGLLMYGFDELARKVQKDAMELVAGQGFRLLYSAQKPKHAVADIASEGQAAAAALFIDLLSGKPLHTMWWG